jgi:hypothetical protein
MQKIVAIIMVLLVAGLAIAMIVLGLGLSIDALMVHSQGWVEIESDSGYYRTFVIDGMPCVWASGGSGGGLSCDWSKYEGD